MLADDDDEERQLRIALMQSQIDKARLDIERVRQEMRGEPWKALAGILVGVAAIAGIILGVAHLIHG
jgi:hypothetical protein